MFLTEHLFSMLMVMCFKRFNKFGFIVCSVISTVPATFLVSYFANLFNVKPTHSEIINNYSPFKFLILLVIIAPLFETLFLQAAIIEFFLYHLNIKKSLIPILTSGIFFGAVHYLNAFNFIYMLAATTMGMLFASIYIIAKKRGDIHPILITFICHLTTNLIAFFIKYF